MKRTAIAFALLFGLGSAYGPMTQFAVAHENPATAQNDKAKLAENTDQKSGDTTSAEKSKEKKHEKKISQKHKRKSEEGNYDQGDGSATALGTHKKVDSGFDFENSKTFHQMGN